MKQNLTHIILVVCLIFSFQKTKAQLSGVYTVPGTYSTIGAAINDLNIQGVNGAVTINIGAGYNETSPFGGYTLTATGTSVNPITIQKNGIGPNPIITAYTGGTATPSSAIQDGVLKLSGCDYITIDGIDITDPNTTNPSTMEYGICFFRNGYSNGCQYNTVKNCTITLSKVNNEPGMGGANDGSRCIEISNSQVNTHTSSISTSTIAACSNSYNKFYSNKLQNCNIGISLHGSTTTNTLYTDQFNDVGGTSYLTGNTILNFGGALSANRPAAGVKSFYQTDLNISFNTVNSNNGTGVNHTNKLDGIYSYPYLLSNQSITNNTISVKGASISNTITAIYLNSWFSNAGTYTANISQNMITNCACSSPTVFSGAMYGICNESKIPVVNINNNIFSNSIITPTLVTFTGFYNNGLSKSVTFNSNLINNITITGGNYAAMFAGIYSYATDPTTTLSVLSNSVQAITITGFYNAPFNFIRNESNPSVVNFIGNKMDNVSLNTVGEVDMIYNASNSQSISVINNSFNSFTNTIQGANVYGYYGNTWGTGSITINQNNFSNAVLTGSTSYQAIMNWGNTGFQSISSNTITNINTTTLVAFGSACTGISSSSSPGMIAQNHIFGCNVKNFTGITLTSFSPGLLTIESNTINSITSDMGAWGIRSGSAGVLNLSKNRIFDIQTNNVNSGITGIGLSSSSGTINISNNLIADLRAPNSNGNIIGINVPASGGNLIKVSYNTIYLNAVSTATQFSAHTFQHNLNTNPNAERLYLNNNIFVNTSIPKGPGGYAAAFYQGGTPILANYDSTSNNNLFYCASTTTNSYIYFGIAAAANNLTILKTALSPREANSVTELPVFTSTVGTSPNFLKVSTSTPTQIENGGIPVSVTDDHGGNLRSVSNPDIGAWEDNYTMKDSVNPAISGITKTNGSCNFSTVTFTANLIDATGVASGSLAPRCYYRVNAGPYNSITGTLISGTTQNGIWSFTPTYTATPYSTLYYYFVAQDVNSISNLGSIPYGCVAANVNSVTTPPPTTYSFTIYGILNGTYTVGTGGNFTTLTEAATAYKLWCITGPVTYLLKDPSYSASESFPITFTTNPDASNTNSLLIRPMNGINTVVSSTWNTGAVFKFLNSKYISIDGINSGGSSLTLDNPYSGAVVWIASTNTISSGGNKKISVLNTKLSGGGGSGTGNFGIVSGMENTSPYFGNGKDNDSITIKNNIINNVYYGISAGGITSLTAGGNDNWIIEGNIIGPSITGTNTIGGNAMQFNFANNFLIKNNLIQGVRVSSTSMAGIYLAYGLNSISIVQNTVTNISSTATTFSSNSICGIYAANTVSNCLIEKNTISGIFNNGSGYFSSRGITINGASNIKIYNNTISDVYSGSGATAPFWPMGLCIEGSANGIDIDNNTIGLAGVRSGGPGNTFSSALFINNLSSNIKLRNNIISNSYSNSSLFTEYCYAFYCLAPASAFTAIDYNNYYVGGLADTLILAYMNSARQTSLAAIQSSFGSNLNSSNIAPTFASISDLHLLPGSNTSLDNTGTPLTIITDDIDNQSRSLTTPDVGADEFSNAPCSSVSGGILGVTNFSSCVGQSFNLNSAGATYASGVNYQWQVSNTSGGPYANVTTGTGANTLSYNTGTLTPGTYYFVLNATCTVSSLSAISNEATVTIYPLPTVSLTASSNPLCIGQTITLTATGANSYTWNPTFTTGTVAVVSVSLSANYTLTGKDINGCVNNSVLSVTATTCVDIEEIQSIYSIALCPNPTSGELILRTGHKENLELEVYNVIGEMILKQAIIKTETNINLKEKANGVYFVRLIENGNTVYYSKIVKQ